MFDFAVNANALSISIRGHEITRVHQLEVRKGELIQIKGSNGSGKTSFLQACAGIIPHITGGKVTGSLEVLDLPLSIATTDSLRGKVVYVPSAIDMFFACATPFEELAFTIAGLKDSRDLKLIHEKTRKGIYEYGLTQFCDDQIADLSYGQRALCAIACAIVSDTHLILLDEVMSSLDTSTRKIIQNLMDRYINNGGAGIVADHDFAWDSARALIFPDRNIPIADNESQPEIDLTQWAHKDGTLVGLMGENGSGKTTLLRHFAGFVDVNNLHSQNYKLATEITQIVNNDTAEVSYLPQESHRVFRSQTLAKELEQIQKTKHVLADIVDTSSFRETNISELSYGQQKIAALTLVMSCGAQLILLDEPTRGLDTQAKQQIIHFLENFSHKNRVTIVCATHDKELIDTCDVVLCASEGTSEKILEGAL